MSHEIKEKILLMDKTSPALSIKERLLKVANKCFDMVDARIKAKGLIGQGKAELIRVGILHKEDAEVELHNSIVDLKVLTDDGVDAYKEMADTVTDVIPNDPPAYRELLFETSKAEATTGTKPPKADGGSAVQAEDAGKASVHCHKCPRTRSYKYWVSSNPDPSILSSYTRTSPDTFWNSHGGIIDVATGVKLWFRVQGSNEHGDGPLSDPFGGNSFSPTV